MISLTGGLDREADTAYKHLASLLAAKRDSPYSTTMGWLRCSLSFAILRSSILCIRGTRLSACHVPRDLPVDLVSAEAQLSTRTIYVFTAFLIFFILTFSFLFIHYFFSIVTCVVYLPCTFNPRCACAARVTVVAVCVCVCVCVCVSVCPLSHISHQGLLRAQRATKVKIFVAFSLKPLRSRDGAIPPLDGHTFGRPFFLRITRMRIVHTQIVQGSRWMLHAISSPCVLTL